MRLADECKVERDPRDTEYIAKVDEDFELVRSELVRLRAALDELDQLNPEDFTDTRHISPAFYEIDFAKVFKRVCEIVNKVLHNTDAYGRPLPEEQPAEQLVDGVRLHPEIGRAHV